MDKVCALFGCENVFPRPTGPGAPKRFCGRECQLEFQKREKRARLGHAQGLSKTPMNASRATEKLDLSPAGWAAWVFKNYELDATQQQLVMMGLEAATVARDPEEDFKAKMSAMGRFQAIISQLNLPKLDVEEEEEVSEPIRVARPSIDPRKQLRVVS